VAKIEPQVVAPVPAADAALVLRSAELRDEAAEPWRPDTDPAAQDLALVLTADVRQLDADVTVPEWLLAAVSVSDSSECTQLEEN
jgi:hypothetical protein